MNFHGDLICELPEGFEPPRFRAHFEFDEVNDFQIAGTFQVLVMKAEEMSRLLGFGVNLLTFYVRPQATIRLAGEVL